MDPGLKQKISSTLFEDSPDAVLFADRDGIILMWNRGAEKLFGYSAAEAVGQSLDLIIPENLRGRHNEGYLRAMASGESKYGDDLLSVPALHKNGERLFSDFSITMIRDSDELLGIAAIMRDTTAQKKKEKELKERLNSLGVDLQ